jgi:hypothetical protein
MRHDSQHVTSRKNVRGQEMNEEYSQAESVYQEA